MREDWVEVELGEVCFTTSGGTPSRQNKSYFEGDIPWVKSGELDKGLILDSEEHISEEAIKNSSAKLFPKGTLLFALYGATIGKMATLGISAASNQAICGIYENDFLLSKYLYHYLSNKKRELIGKGIGGAQPNISQTILKQLPISLAPLPEQRAIVAKIETLFSDLDKGIADLKTAQAQLKVYRQAVLKKAFEGELTKEWREQQTNLPTAEALLAQIKEERQKHYEQQLEDWKNAVTAWEENGKEGKKCSKPKKLIEISNLSEAELSKLDPLPNEWVYSYLSYAGELARGKSKHRPRNDFKLFENGKYPFIQTGDVKAQKIITEFNKKYSDFGLQQSKLWTKGTLCITIAANIAETGFLGIDACFPDSIVGFTPFNVIIEDQFIEYFFQLAKNRIAAYAPATAQKNINLTILEKLVVPFCSKEEQHQIVQEIESRLSVCDKVEQSITESLEKAKALRQSILKKAFEGSLLSTAEIEQCKQAPDYEPAAALLAKIKAEKSKK